MCPLDWPSITRHAQWASSSAKTLRRVDQFITEAPPVNPALITDSKSINRTDRTVLARCAGKCIKQMVDEEDWEPSNYITTTCWSFKRCNMTSLARHLAYGMFIFSCVCIWLLSQRSYHFRTDSAKGEKCVSLRQRNKEHVVLPEGMCPCAELKVSSKNQTQSNLFLCDKHFCCGRPFINWRSASCSVEQGAHQIISRIELERCKWVAG